jgi:hypothetical protein
VSQLIQDITMLTDPATGRVFFAIFINGVVEHNAGIDGVDGVNHRQLVLEKAFIVFQVMRHHTQFLNLLAFITTLLLFDRAISELMTVRIARITL